MPDVTADRPIDIEAEVAQLEQLAGWLDARWGLPGTRFRFGLDSVVGLVPGIGDALTFLPAAYLVWRARQLGMPTSTVLRMCSNVGIDTVFGAVPLVGDLFDAGFKCNRRNIALLRRHLAAEAARSGRAAP